VRVRDALIDSFDVSSDGSVVMVSVLVIYCVWCGMISRKIESYYLLFYKFHSIDIHRDANRQLLSNKRIYTDAFGQLLNQYTARCAWVTASSTQTVVVCRQSSDCPILSFSHSPQFDSSAGILFFY